MAFFGYVRKSLNSNASPRVGVAYVQKFRGPRGGVLGLIGFIIGLAALVFYWDLIVAYTK